MDLWTLLAFIFTLFVFSYLLGDNFLFRLAMYVFVGLAAAYTARITVESILIPLLNPDAGALVLLIAATILTGMLLAKPFARLSGITNLALAFLIAVGTVVAIVGAVSGTIIPLVLSTSQAPAESGLAEGIVLFIGVASSLLYFQTLGRRNADGTVGRGRVMSWVSRVGEAFIVVTLGALYGTAILTSLTILVERSSFLVNRIVGGG